MIRRPKPGDSEEDILLMQEEFLTNKNLQPSVHVVNLRQTENQATKRPGSTTSESRKPSKYAKSKLRTDEKNQQGIISSNDNLEKTTALREFEDDNVYYPKVLPSVLGDIVEKSYDDFSYDFKPTTSKGFSFEFIHNSCKIIKEKRENIGMKQPPSSDPVLNRETKALNIPSQSYILSNTEADDIHRQNVKILTKMNESEILEEQQKLLANLDQKLVEFIRAMKKQPTTSKMYKDVDSEDITSKSKDRCITEVETKQIESIENLVSSISDDLWENDVLSHPSVNQWLHCDNFEKEKLEWIKSIENSKTVNPNEPYEARFDFKGYLLPYTIEYTEKSKSLFHHGEEPHRPGYSITELIELTRSTVLQQRVIALNIIAGILEYSMAGIYKDVVDIPLTKLFFIIRIAMDENKIILLEPALRAMRNILFNRIDEACLDALLGFEEGTYQPSLENDKSEIEEIESKESELKDYHLAEIDLITAVLRTDILQRLYYILECLQPSFNCVQYSIQIIIRLCRDSIEVAYKIVQSKYLLDTVIKKFLPTTSINFTFNPNIVFIGKPILAALKLIRILALQSRDIGDILITKYHILQPLSEYISSGVDGTYGLRLQIEAFCILSNLLTYDLGIEDTMLLSPVILTTLYKHVKSTDIFINAPVLSITHAAVVVQFINKLLNCNNGNLDNIKQQVYPLIREGAQKWLLQSAHLDSYTCGHLRLLCAVLDCCKTIITTENVKLPFLNDALKILCASNGFKIIFSNIQLSSNLLSGIKDNDLYCVNNIVSLGGSVNNSTQTVLPVLSTTSPIPFLVSLFKLLNIVNDRHIANLFMNNILNYLQELSKKPLSLKNNWFTRMEVELVFEIVKLSTQSDISESLRDVIYPLASKLCYILRVDKKYELEFLFNKIIFNKQWFTADRLFNTISLNQENNFLNSLSSTEDIRACYIKLVNLNHIKSTGTIVLKKWKEPILPRDWIYLPILLLYGNSHDAIFASSKIINQTNKIATQRVAERELIIRCSLEWILFNEISFPDLLNDIDVTDRFCRIMCVFLCDNSLFLDEKINSVLKRCICMLFKYSDKFNFDKPLTGLSNFEDFYKQFLEQFQSVSYGDHTFASCVLVPLAQRHNVKWRKLLWSEYAGCLRALDCPEELLCYNVNEYMYPEETDESLLKSYFRALSSNILKSGTIAYKIAHHHVEMFKNKKAINC